MKFPKTLSNNKERLKYLYRVQELLRLEHNAKGKDFRDGNITEKEFKHYQKHDFELRLNNVLHERNNILEAEGVTKVTLDNKFTTKQIEFRQLKEAGTIDKKWDVDIDVKSIEKSGENIETTDPVEDFSGYTETDPNSEITVTSTKITGTNFRRPQSAYVYKDKGADHFNADFEHFLTAYLASISTGNASFWILSNYVGNAVNQKANTNAHLRGCIDHGGGTPIMQLVEWADPSEYADNYAISTGTPYYLKVKRDESVGTYGTAYIYIYSDSSRTTLLDTLSLTLHVAKRDYRYIYGMCSTGGGDAGYVLTFYSENLDLQEIPPAVGRSRGIIF
jgi:hypothetical protein